MSILSREGHHSSKARKAVVTALAVGAFQVLAVVGAGVASAAGTCTFDLSTSTVNVVITAGTASTLAVSDGTVAPTVAGDILFDGVACGGSPKISNTTKVTVTTTVPSGTETFTIDNSFGAPDQEFPSTIAWFVDLGTAVGDTLIVTGSDDADDPVVVTETSFTMNDAVGTTAGIEAYTLNGQAGDDTLDASALTSSPVNLNGLAGDDWLAPGLAPNDNITGGADVDTVSYGGRTGCIAILNNLITDTGSDNNCDGDSADLGEESDNLLDVLEVLESGSGNDTLVGTGAAETFIPGDGDDDITGGGGADVIDWSSSSAGMVIDPANGSATGQGTDTFAGPVRFIGSALDDTLIWDGTTLGFVGGDGTDKVDASARTVGNSIDLDTLDGTPVSGVGAPADTLENAIGGSANDSLLGNDARNRLEGGEGDDTLSGFAGNDFLIGSAGNDTYSGGTGADKVSFKNSPNGITADLLAGFATGEGDDSLAGDIEIVVGSQHKDSIVGGGGVVATNFNFVGNNGKDTLTGSGSNDTLKGGGGADVLRGVNGDDTLTGGNGNDRIFGGTGTDIGNGGNGKDTCKGVEIRNSCGKQGNPRIAKADSMKAKLGRL